MIEPHDLSGRQVGRYRVRSLIGAGGMGAVYEASDPDLQRVVALKILPPALVADRARLQRFTQEARTASALNHPHVVSVHEVGVQQFDDHVIHYIAMERVEGRTLRGALAEGGLPLRKMLELMGQVADAVGAAHGAGIVHRDLKPENIMVTTTGYAKVLDFGLAKLRDDGEPSQQDQSTRVMFTSTGAILGTVGYMSPEQAQGKAADARSDIFAIGCILYEAVTGRRAFKGASAVDTLHNIIYAEPELVQVLAPATPPELLRVIRKTLAKDPDARYQSAKDLAIDLRDLARGNGSVPVAPQTEGARRRVFPLLMIGAAAFLLIALLGWFTPRVLRRTAAAGTSLVLQFTPPGDLVIGRSPEDTRFTVSPDGTMICFSGERGDASSLYVRRLDSAVVRKLEGTEDATAPFWSPDGEWIGYSAKGRLWKTRAAGGTSAEAICEVPVAGAVASWGKGAILFADRPGGRRQIMRVSDAGGTPVPVTTVGTNEWRHTFPYWLADGEHFLYLALAVGSIERNVVRASTRSAERTVVVRGALKAEAVGSDRLVFAREGRLLSQRMDPKSGTVLGDATPVASDLECFTPTGHAEFSTSQNGVLVYRTNTSSGRLAILDRKGAEVRLLDDRGPFLNTVSLSPDGRKAAVTHMARATGFGDIWIYDTARALRERLSSEPGMEVYPVWAPDGRSIIYSATPGGTAPFLVRRSLAGSSVEPLLPGGRFQIARSFSPEGTSLFFARLDPRTGSDLFRLDLATRRTEAVFSTGFAEEEPEVSPSGQWLAFSSNETGPHEVYLHDLSSAESPRTRISSKGGKDARWRADGRELFYVGGDSHAVMSATPRTPGRWDDPVVAELFRLKSTIIGFDVSDDGKSFLIATGTRGAEDASLHLILGAK